MGKWKVENVNTEIKKHKWEFERTRATALYNILIRSTNYALI